MSDNVSEDEVTFVEQAKVDMAIEGGLRSFFGCLIVL